MNIKLQIGDTFTNNEGVKQEIVSERGVGFRIRDCYKGPESVYYLDTILDRIKTGYYSNYVPIKYKNIQVGDVCINTSGKITKLTEINKDTYTFQNTGGYSIINKEDFIPMLLNDEYTDYHSIDTLKTVVLGPGDTFTDKNNNSVEIQKVEGGRCSITIGRYSKVVSKHEIQLLLLKGCHKDYRPAPSVQVSKLPENIKIGQYQGEDALKVYLEYFKPLFKRQNENPLEVNIKHFKGFFWNEVAVFSSFFKEEDLKSFTKQEIINNLTINNNNHEQITEIKSDSRREIRGKQITSNKARKVATASRLVGDAISYRTPRTITRDFKIKRSIISI